MSPVSTPKTTIGYWDGQAVHFGGLAVLLIGAAWGWSKVAPLEGRAFGASGDVWFWASIAIPVVHQVYVWICWRIELRNRAVSRAIGFGGYAAGFFLFFFARFVAFWALAWATRGTLAVAFPVQMIVTIALAAPAAYAMYSVVLYFGMARAAGADHFDERYRQMPLVRGGIFRYTSNGMYGFGFLFFWALAVGCASTAALIAAAFCHAYIWVHFYATERPDMHVLYG